jgi:hypothetical protein
VERLRTAADILEAAPAECEAIASLRASHLAWCLFLDMTGLAQALFGQRFFAVTEDGLDLLEEDEQEALVLALFEESAAPATARSFVEGYLRHELAEIAELENKLAQGLR